jgi:hypothetical protein
MRLNMSSQNQTNTQKNIQKRKSNVQCVITEKDRKDYALMLCHNKKCKLILEDNNILIGLCHCKDPQMILIDLENGDREIINKRHVKRIVLLKEGNKN